MRRLVRTLVTLGFLLGFLLRPAAGRAQEQRVTPRDVPILVGAAQAAVPPVPGTYVTRDFGWLTFSYPPVAAERVESILRDADSVKAELARALGQGVLEHLEVRVAETAADMARLAPAAAPPPDYASGVAYSALHLVLLTMMPPRGAEAVDLDEVFRHELAHVALEDAVLGHHVPVWFNEGTAIALSGESALARRQTLWSATLSGTLIPLADLDRSFPVDPHEVNVAYAQAADFMGFLMRRSDRLRFASMIERVRGGDTFERAISDAYGSDLRKLEFQWRGDVEKRYSVIPILTGGGVLWVSMIVGFAVAYVRRRRRAKAILERWAREEAYEDALRARAAAKAESRDTFPVPAPALAPAKVEHDGRFHTLH